MPRKYRPHVWHLLRDAGHALGYYPESLSMYIQIPLEHLRLFLTRIVNEEAFMLYDGMIAQKHLSESCKRN